MTLAPEVSPTCPYCGHAWADHEEWGVGEDTTLRCYSCPTEPSSFGETAHVCARNN